MGTIAISDGDTDDEYKDDNEEENEEQTEVRRSTIGIRAVDEKSARRPKYPSSRNRTHRVRIGRCV